MRRYNAPAILAALIIIAGPVAAYAAILGYVLGG